MKDATSFVIIGAMGIIGVVALFVFAGYSTHEIRLKCVESGGQLIGDRCFRVCLDKEIQLPEGVK